MKRIIITSTVMALIAVAITVALAIAIIRVDGGQKDSRFRVVERFEGGCVWVDTETGIGYGQIYGAGSVFPMYDADGDHYRPNGWRDNG